MPQAFRLLCVYLSAALLAVLNVHGVAESQHALGHGAGWPPVALTAADDDHGGHVHRAPTEAPDDSSETAGGGAQPEGHHHHGGGDPHAAMPSVSRGAVGVPAPAAGLLTPGADQAMAEFEREGPEDPPKRTLTVI